MEQWSIGGIQSQHGGQAGGDTAWLQVDPKNVQNWLREPDCCINSSVNALFISIPVVCDLYSYYLLSIKNKYSRFEESPS